jgi:hypothetical protein
MCTAKLIPKSPRVAYDTEDGYFLVSRLGPDSPLPQAGWTYKIHAVTTPEAHWDNLPFQPRGNIVSFEVLASTDAMAGMTSMDSGDDDDDDDDDDEGDDEA